MSKHVDNLKVEKLPDSEAVITGHITVEYLTECRAEALKVLNERTEIDGFRKGHIPEDTLVKKIGEMRILEETAEVAIGREYPAIIKESGINPISRPDVSITKLAPGIPLEFKIKVILEPVFELPDYKKIAKGIKAEENLEVTDVEIDAVLEEVKKQNWTPDLKEGENLRDKARENIAKEKEFRQKEKKRLGMIDALVKATEVSLPGVLVQGELEKMLAQFKDDVSRANVQWDEYLKSIEKTEDAIKDEWKPKAIERVKAEMIIAKIAEAEKIEPSVEDLEHEVKHLIEHYPDADPLRARVYIYGLLRNEKVLQFLEEQK